MMMTLSEPTPKIRHLNVVFFHFFHLWKNKPVAPSVGSIITWRSMRNLLLPLFLLNLPSRSASFGSGTFALPFSSGAAFSHPQGVFFARGCARTRCLAASAASPSPRTPALAPHRAVSARHILARSRMISCSASEGADGPAPLKKQCSVSGMRYRVDEPGTLSSPRTHAIFLHGLSSSSETCQVPKDVLDLGATWLVPDLMGHGDSPRPLGAESYTVSEQKRATQGEGTRERGSGSGQVRGPVLSCDTTRSSLGP